jgi:hypothetical protein
MVEQTHLIITFENNSLRLNWVGRRGKTDKDKKRKAGKVTAGSYLNRWLRIPGANLPSQALRFIVVCCDISEELYYPDSSLI